MFNISFPTYTTALLALKFYALFLWYYIKKITLLPIAYIGNRSFLIRHPTNLFPTTIAPARNTTIYSFFITESTVIELDIPLASDKREWLSPHHLGERLFSVRLFERAVIADGKLSGPLLQQGMVVLIHQHPFYIGEELGRWPGHEEYVATLTVNLRARSTFILFIPAKHFTTRGLIGKGPSFIFHNPIPLSTAIAQRVEEVFPSPPPPADSKDDITTLCPKEQSPPHSPSLESV